MDGFKFEENEENLVEIISQTLATDDKFDPSDCLVYYIYVQLKVLGLLPQVVPNPSKSDALSEKFRNSGNIEFVQKKDDMEALKFYTKAVSAATLRGTDICLAYANRSAVTFALEEYTDCIKDINRALNGSYPNNLRYKLYERRGRAHVALSQYRTALDDFTQFKTSVQNSKLSEDKIKLLMARVDEVIEECKDKENIVITPVKVTLSLTHSPSSHIQCASSAVGIEYSPEMGRHLIAQTDIFPGDIVAIEKPYAAVLWSWFFEFFCDNCRKRCHSLVPCLHCCNVLFCDETCREQGWSSHHSIECNMIPTLMNQSTKRTDRIALRVLLNATKCGKDFSFLKNSNFKNDSSPPETRGFVDNMYRSDDYTSTHFLQTNLSSRSDKDIIQRKVCAAILLHLLKEATNFLNGDIDVGDVESAHVLAGELIFKHMMTVSCNAHEISEMRVWPSEMTTWESTEIGGAIYPFLSLVNHSCDPNVVRQTHNGDMMSLSAIQVIKKGEQLFDNYGYHHAVLDRKARREFLLSQYYFTCECEACIWDWPLFTKLPDEKAKPSIASESTKKLSRIVETLAKSILIDEDFQFLTSHLTFLQENVKRPWREYSVCQEALKHFLGLRANHYIYKRKI